jgi:parallel beta-helix repeat protein
MQVFYGLYGYGATHTVVFKEITVTGGLPLPSEVWVDDDWTGLSQGYEVEPGKFIGYNAFAKIQDAINAVTSGGRIIVYEGTYYENIVINKPLTLTSASLPIIDGGAAGDCITVSTNNVVINGFEIRNGYNGITGETDASTFSNNVIHDNLNILGYAGVGVLLWGDNDNNLITGNEIYNNDRQGIFIGYSDTTKISTKNVISHNIVYNNGLYRYANGPDASAYGVQLWCADNNVIEYNEIYNHDDWFPYGGTFDFAQGIYLCASFNNILRGNSLHDNNYGVGVWAAGRTPVGSNQINYNNIAGNTGFGIRTFDTVATDARFNWWGDASGPTHSSNVGGTGDKISDNVDYSPWLGYGFEVTPRTYHVNPTGAPSAIQEAINEASSGDTILVHDGTYLEALYVNDKSLTIKAASKPVIKGSQLFATDYGDREAVIFVKNAELVLENLDIEGEGLGPGPTRSYGVLYQNSSGAIKDCIVSPNTIGDMYSIAVAAISRSDLIVENNLIQNFGRIGVYATNVKNIYIHKNEIIGQTYSQNNLVNYGIEIEDWDGASTAQIIENKIHNSNNTHPSPQWSSAGIIVDIWRMFYELSPSNVSMEYNEIYDNYLAIEVVSNPSLYAHYNNIYNNAYGVYVDPDLYNNYEPFDARFNWWGHETGPLHETSWMYMGEPYGPHYGLGDSVGDYVLYVPWLQVVHDVAVTDVSVSPTTVVAGETVTIDVTVENQGTDSESFTVTVYYDDTAIASQDIVNLFPGWSTTITFYWDTTGMPRGTYTIKAIASTVLGETDIQDNTLVDGTVEILWHDVAVIDVTPEGTWVYQGYSININVTVTNEGDFPETVTVTLYYNITANKIIGTQTINLGIGENQTLIFTWDTTGVKYCHNYTITAVAEISFDNDPTDNTFTDGKVKVRILGDINGDGKVDIRDLSIVASAFGETPERPRWDERADINKDGKVDIRDISIVAKNFGKSC